VPLFHNLLAKKGKKEDVNAWVGIIYSELNDSVKSRSKKNRP
jgi:hypothetical protein